MGPRKRHAAALYEEITASYRGDTYTLSKTQQAIRAHVLRGRSRGFERHPSPYPRTERGRFDPNDPPGWRRGRQ